MKSARARSTTASGPLMHLSSVSIAPLSGKMMVARLYIHIPWPGELTSWPALRSASAALRSASAGFRLDSTQPCSRFSVRNSIIRARSLLNPRVTRRYRGFLGFFVGALIHTQLRAVGTRFNLLPRTQGLEKRRRVSKRTSLYTRSISHAVRVEEPPHLRPPLLYLLDRSRCGFRHGDGRELSIGRLAS